MYLRIYTVLCCAILAGFATAAQNNQQNSDLSFNEDAEFEGSGNEGEVTHDLEASGSGYGPDDEDTPIDTRVKSRENLDDQAPTPTDPPTNTVKTPEGKNLPPNTNNHPTEEDQGVKMDPNLSERQTSFFAQPGILAAVIGGAVVGLLCAILVVMFIVYRMRKKDEGSYSLGEPKPSPNANTYNRGNEKEFFA